MFYTQIYYYARVVILATIKKICKTGNSWYVCIKQGQSGVGKSNIISRYIQNKFNISSNITIGLQFSQKQINVNQKNITLQIWDTAGQERYRSLNKNFYKNSLGAIVVFDIANKSSFLNLKKWVDELRQNLSQNIVLLLLANKCDIQNKQISVGEALEFAKNQKMGFLQVSAALNININNAFQLITKKILQMNQSFSAFKIQKQSPMKLKPKNINQKKQKKKKCCKQ